MGKVEVPGGQAVKAVICGEGKRFLSGTNFLIRSRGELSSSSLRLGERGSALSHPPGSVEKAP
jgi:hypothetical protein